MSEYIARIFNNSHVAAIRLPTPAALEEHGPHFVIEPFLRERGHLLKHVDFKSVLRQAGWEYELGERGSRGVIRMKPGEASNLTFHSACEYLQSQTDGELRKKARMERPRAWRDLQKMR